MTTLASIAILLALLATGSQPLSGRQFTDGKEGKTETSGTLRGRLLDWQGQPLVAELSVITTEVSRTTGMVHRSST